MGFVAVCVEFSRVDVTLCPILLSLQGGVEFRWVLEAVGLMFDVGRGFGGVQVLMSSRILGNFWDIVFEFGVA